MYLTWCKLQSFASRKSALSHFLHLSVQEVLTALHISKLPPAEQVSIFNEMFDNPRFAFVRLVLYDCDLRIDADSCPLLVEMLQENRTLKDMNLSSNFMSDGALLALGEGLKENRGLTTLFMKVAGPWVGAMQQFVLCLKKNRHLTELHMDNSSTVHWATAAVNETRLRMFDFSIPFYYDTDLCLCVINLFVIGESST